MSDPGVGMEFRAQLAWQALQDSREHKLCLGHLESLRGWMMSEGCHLEVPLAASIITHAILITKKCMQAMLGDMVATKFAEIADVSTDVTNLGWMHVRRVDHQTLSSALTKAQNELADLKGDERPAARSRLIPIPFQIS